ncbi:MAG: hypothetical protein ACI83B_001799 [Sediminicola sp.]|jgi:hypothetical protein
MFYRAEKILHEIQANFSKEFNHYFMLVLIKQNSGYQYIFPQTV